MRDSLKSKSTLGYWFADGNGRIEIRWEEYDAVERRHTYHYRISTADLAIDAWNYQASDLRSGSGDPVSLPRALADLLSFLEAFSESRRSGNPESENWNLFPDRLAAWAESMSDEFGMAREEIEPSE